MATPPTFESVIEKLKTFTGPGKGPSDILKATESLSNEEKEVLANNPDKVANISDEEKTRIGLALAKMLTSDEGLNHLKNAALVTTRAIEASMVMFASLGSQLNTLEYKFQVPDKEKFTPDLQIHKDTFLALIKTSQVLASRTATYGKQFGETVLPVVLNKRLSTDVKKRQVKQYIDDAEEFREESEKMEKGFTELLTKFDDFTKRFIEFGATKGKELNSTVAELEKQSLELRAKIDKIKSGTTTGMGILAGIGALAFVFIGLAFPPAIPGLITAACCVGGIELIAGASAGFALSVLQDDLTKLNKQRDDARKALDDFNAARSDLVKMGEEDLAIFTKCIGGLTKVWRSAQLHAIEIQDWLNRGEPLVGEDCPAIIRNQFEHAVDIYAAMATYLTEYAHGVSNSEVLMKQ